MYAVWIKIDETLPWIELKGTHQTKGKAKKAAMEILNHVQIRVVEMPEKKRQVKALATRH